MPLPEDFNQSEHTKSVLRQTFNKEVREEFRDIEDDDNISIPRGSLKRACLIDENDTIDIINAKMNFFYFTLRKAQDLFPPMYGIFREDYESEKKYKPYCKLMFFEKWSDTDLGYKPLVGELSFRIKNTGSLTETELQNLARKIKEEFTEPHIYEWKRGKDMLSYGDKQNSYFTQILCRNKTDGLALLRKVLECADLEYNDKWVTYAESQSPTERYPTIPETVQTPRGLRKKPRSRPICTVNFSYAIADGMGWGQPIILVDCTGRYNSAYEKIRK